MVGRKEVLKILDGARHVLQPVLHGGQQFVTDQRGLLPKVTSKPEIGAQFGQLSAQTGQWGAPLVGQHADGLADGDKAGLLHQRLLLMPETRPGFAGPPPLGHQHGREMQQYHQRLKGQGHRQVVDLIAQGERGKQAGRDEKRAMAQQIQPGMG